MLVPGPDVGTRNIGPLVFAKSEGETSNLDFLSLFSETEPNSFSFNSGHEEKFVILSTD